MITLVVAVVAFFCGSLCRGERNTCDCCEHYDHEWRKPRADENPDETAICDRCGVCLSETDEDEEIVA